MNIYSNAWDEQTHRKPILEIWRKIKEREQMEDTSSRLQEDSSDIESQEEPVN